jgi:uncharacterized protein
MLSNIQAIAHLIKHLYFNVKKPSDTKVLLKSISETFKVPLSISYIKSDGLTRFLRMRCVLILIFVCCIDYVFAQQPVVLKVTDQLMPAETVRLTGFIGNKLDASFENRILAQDINRLVDPFKNRTEESCWQSEFWGKWFTSAVQAYKYSPEPRLKALIDTAVMKLLATQTPDGYIGNYTDAKHLEQWDIWGRKYCMLGLLSYYDLTKDRNSLLAARRIADHLIKELADKKTSIVRKGNHRGMAATSILEPISLLYARTGDKRYLNFAEEIVRQWESPIGPRLISKTSVNVSERFPKPHNWWGYEQGQKAYEMMSCYEGLLELYRLTGNRIYKNAVIKTWENIRETEINIVGSGSSMECWFGGKKVQQLVSKHYQETCVTATWIKLSLQLLRLTGEARYADAIEQSFYNALLGSMKPDGSTWAKYSPILGIRTEGEDQCHMGLNCCVASGPRGLFAVPPAVVMRERQGLIVNFFNSGTYEVITPNGQKAALIQQTDYPVSGNITIQVKVPKPEAFKISIRIPNWSSFSELTVNGKVIQNLIPGNYVALNQTWNTTNDITLTLDMRGRLQRIKGQPSYIAIVRGPIVLARDRRMEGNADVDETITPVLTKDGFVPLEVDSSAHNENIWMFFKTPCLVGSYREETTGKPVSLEFCDYGSAGNTYNEQSRFRIWFPQLLDPSEKKIMD